MYTDFVRCMGTLAINCHFNKGKEKTWPTQIAITATAKDDED